MILRKHVLIAVLLVLLAVVAIAGARWKHTESNPSTPVVLKIGVSQTPLSAPLIVAQQRGLFAKYGVKVDVVPCYGGVECARFLFEQNVDFATASESVVMFESFKRDDFVMLASFVESGFDLKLLTLAENDIYQISGLNGKKVGVVKASASEFFLDSMLMSSDVPGTKVEKVYAPFTRLDDILISGEVDAVSVWEPLGYQLQNNPRVDVVDLSIPGIYQLSFNLLTTRENVTRYQDESIRILLALEEAEEWIQAHPLEVQKLVANYLNIPLGQLSWSWNDYIYRLSLGNGLLSNLQVQARWALEKGLVTGPMPDYRKIVDRHILIQAQRRKGLDVK